jgi:hypothetical protein
MTRITQNPITSNGKDHSKLPSYSLREESGKSDREAGRDYVPMNVYIDPWTMRTRFQGLSIQSS